jgi:hypothetical protein
MNDQNRQKDFSLLCTPTPGSNLQKGIRIYPSTVSVPYRTVPYRFLRGSYGSAGHPA